MDVIGNNRPEDFLKKIKGQFSTFGTFFLITDKVYYLSPGDFSAFSAKAKTLHNETYELTSIVEYNRRYRK